MWARLGEKGDKASEKGKKVLEKMPPTSTRDKISYSGIFPKSFKLPCEKKGVHLKILTLVINTRARMRSYGTNMHDVQSGWQAV